MTTIIITIYLAVAILFYFIEVRKQVTGWFIQIWITLFWPFAVGLAVMLWVADNARRLF